MFAATITLTINAVPYVMQRVNQDSYGSEYHIDGALDSLNLKVRHSSDGVDKDGIVMKRHNVFVERIIYPTSTELMKKQTCTFTMRGGKFESPTPVADIAKAVQVWLAASSYAVTTGLSIGEN